MKVVALGVLEVRGNRGRGKADLVYLLINPGK
jgi:hypothetical protein